MRNTVVVSCALLFTLFGCRRSELRDVPTSPEVEAIVAPSHARAEQAVEMRPGLMSLLVLTGAVVNTLATPGAHPCGTNECAASRIVEQTAALMHEPHEPAVAQALAQR